MVSVFRKIFFLIAVLTYLLIAPFLIIYAFGYKWEYKEAILRETGIISLKSYPEKADIFINDILYQDKTPSWISGLSPGNYKLKIAKQGFFEWGKLLEVKPRMVTKAEYILLIPNRIQAQPIFEDSEVIDFVAARNSKGIGVLIKNKFDEYNFFLVSNLEPQPKQILIQNPKFKKKDFLKKLKLDSFSKSNSYLMINFSDSLSKDYLVIKLSSGEIIEINKKFNINPAMIKWSENEEGVLYFIQDRFIGKIDLASDRKFLGEFKADSFDLLGDKIYLFNRESASVALLDSNLKEINFIGKNDYFTELLFKNRESETYRILMGKNFLNIFKSNTAVFLSDKGDLFFTKPPYFLDRAVKTAIFSEDSRRIVYYNGKIYCYNLKFDEDSNDIYFSPLPQKEEVFAPKGNVKSMSFFIDNNHIIFDEGESLVVLELHGGEKRNFYKIYNRVLNEKFFFSNSEERLYFIDLDKNTKKKNLFKIDFY